MKKLGLYYDGYNFAIGKIIDENTISLEGHIFQNIRQELKDVEEFNPGVPMFLDIESAIETSNFKGLSKEEQRYLMAVNNSLEARNFLAFYSDCLNQEIKTRIKYENKLARIEELSKELSESEEEIEK